MSTIKLTVNGKAVSVEVEDRTLLVHLLREHLNLTGTHVGCDTSQCGACVVLIDGQAVKSCTVLAGQAAGSSVTTIEGIAKGDELHPMQAAFRVGPLARLKLAEPVPGRRRVYSSARSTRTGRGEGAWRLSTSGHMASQ